MKLGVDHVGYQVDAVDTTVRGIRSLGGKHPNQRNQVSHSDPSKPQSYFEVKSVAPDTQVMDVPNAGWVGVNK